MLSQALIKNSGAERGTVPGIHSFFLGGWVGGCKGGCLQTPSSSPPNCRSVTFPSEQRGYLRGAGAHFSGKGTGVILVWISSLFSALKHKGEGGLGGLGGGDLPRQALPPAFVTFSPTTHPLPSPRTHTHTNTHTHTHTHLPLWPQEVLRKPNTNQNMGSDLVPPS